MVNKNGGDLGVDGILGLSPDNGSNGPSFISALYHQKIIDKRQVGFYITEEKNQSFAEFGGFDQTFINNQSSIEWFDLKVDKWWAIELEGAKYSGDSIMKNSDCIGVVDTGTSLIGLPFNDWTVLAKKL